MTESSVPGRRISRLAAELEDDIGVRNLTPMELDEILYAVRPHVHEGRVPSYGAIVHRRPPQLGAAVQRFIVRKTPPADWTEVAVGEVVDMRPFADGRASFVVRRLHGSRLRMYNHPFGDELSLAKLARGPWTVVQRTAAGQVRVFRRNRVITRGPASQWWSKPSATLYLEGLKATVSGPQNLSTASSILDLCVHQLSAANIGATIVQRATKGGRLGHADFTPALQLGAPISIVDPSTHAAVRSKLSQTDRAAIVASDGRLTHVGATLLGEVDSVRQPAEGGTRHNSARDFSACEPSSIVYVVSSDGPVTVFRAGEKLVDTAGFANEESDEIECPQCGVPDIEEDEDGSAVIGFVSNDASCTMCGGTGSIAETHIVVVPHRS